MSAQPPRVVITGFGLISPLGNTVEQFWKCLCDGTSGIRQLQSIPTDHLPLQYGAEATEFTENIADFGDLPKDQLRAIKKGQRVMCREIQMGVAAAQRALQHACFDVTAGDPLRSGIVYGSDYIMTKPEEFCDAIAESTDEQGTFHFERWAPQGLPKVTPLWLLKYLPNMPASHIAIYNDFRGPNNSLTLREASSNLAVAEAYHTIRRGSADLMIAGATGTRVHPLRTLHVIIQEEVARPEDDPTTMSRPFDARRTGSVVSEGAAALILETLEHAQARGATIYGEVLGYGSSAALSRTGKVDVEQAVTNVLSAALKSSQLSAEQLGHVNAHGLGTRAMDAAEARGILNVAGSQTPVITPKGHYGNPGAAGGMLEMISSLLALEHQQLFPVRNFETPDPETPIRINVPTDQPGDCFVNLSVTPTGQASSVCVGRFAG